MNPKKCTTCVYAKFRILDKKRDLSKGGECTLPTIILPNCFISNMGTHITMPIPNPISKYTTPNCPFHKTGRFKYKSE